MPVWILTERVCTSVEDLLLRLARSGQIQKKVSETELIGLLDQLSQQESKANKTKIVVSICEHYFDAQNFVHQFLLTAVKI